MLGSVKLLRFVKEKALFPLDTYSPAVTLASQKSKKGINQIKLLYNVSLYIKTWVQKAQNIMYAKF